jgi:hypothetical protein
VRVALPVLLARASEQPDKFVRVVALAQLAEATVVTGEIGRQKVGAELALDDAS